MYRSGVRKTHATTKQLRPRANTFSDYQIAKARSRRKSQRSLVLESNETRTFNASRRIKASVWETTKRSNGRGQGLHHSSLSHNTATRLRPDQGSRKDNLLGQRRRHSTRPIM